NRMNARFFNLITVTLTLLASGSLSLAQSETNSPNRPPMFSGGSTRLTPAYERLMNSLTQEQRASLRELMTEQREKVRELEGRVREARRAMFIAGVVETFDEKKVREKASEAAKADA